MSFQDKSLQCTDCDTTFAFTAEEQDFFQTRGYTNEPKRCPECRQARKSNNNRNNGYGTRRQMFPVTCSECGKSTEVPFEPHNDKPVYCSDCYRNVRPARY